jgi:excinuclease UvrABC nuclease subunit
MGKKSPAFKFIEKEWSTPDTYDRNYKAIPECSGVYFLVHRDHNFLKSLKVKYKILYVGSSKNLKQRYRSHEVHRILREIFGDVVFYFKETDNYIEEEKALIKQTEARFNKQWR